MNQGTNVNTAGVAPFAEFPSFDLAQGVAANASAFTWHGGLQYRDTWTGQVRGGVGFKFLSNLTGLDLGPIVLFDESAGPSRPFPTAVVSPWAPEFGGRKWVLRVQDWPSQNGVFVSRGKGTASAHPIPIERTSSFFSGGGKPFLPPNSGAQVSPLSNINVAAMNVRNERAWTHGPSWELTSVPAGFTHAVLVITGGWGIRNTLKKYGQFMLKAKGTKRLRDPSLKYLGVFTDNGAFYDAGWWPAFQKTSHDASATFKNLSESYKQLDIPVHYIQLDDWWYANATAHNLTQSGIVACTQSFAPTSANGSDVGVPLFPQGLQPLQKQFGGGE